MPSMLGGREVFGGPVRVQGMGYGVPNGGLRPPLLMPSMLGGREVFGGPVRVRGTRYWVSGMRYQDAVYKYGALSYSSSAKQRY
ncbi:hypothetical protein LWI28_014007 [Acer negundo]|uniref:Uncharacterized protein n=1 Tax=Acer negundo TaxID=4023 RepID=A0AAD5P1Y7_ACENE|nr:hypothetical protein LWI28_014007 [Acer negundo]